ncbi:hypothetical protein BO71DRAFT_429316 [Aspergillus ellipticus CBS 707.79]|uniref:Uncharacterized protein n=1 Tax=Aspergillus ellipticus CBS 707.79 TaxID=1448320 RepID=A0A319DM38_9EURO|nr:hypothetical protein BO71DRAFT_429316 [Aspergillus ellipticus CBS 707.79]
MDPAAADRLKSLQMEDLGTARREYISTSDGRGNFRVRVEDIEATRESNIPGSNAQRMAEANRASLTDWASDTEDLEQLDSLLDGQTHRINRVAAIHGRCVSRSSSMSAGRGGGIAGTRGRDDRHSPTLAGISSREGVSKPGNRGAQTHTSQRRRENPGVFSDFYAKDRDYNASSKEKAAKTQKNQPYNPKPTPKPTPRTRKQLPPSMEGHPCTISTPEEFLAAVAARKGNLEDANTTRVTSAGVAKNSDDGRPAKSQIGADLVHPALKEPTPRVQLPKEDKRSISTGVEPTQNLQSTSKLTTTQAQMKGQPKSNIFTAGTPSRSKPRGASISGGTYGRSTTAMNITDDVLLDFSSTPPEQSFLSGTPGTIISPSFEDLKGLDFQQDRVETPTRQCSTSPETPVPRESAVSLDARETSTMDHSPTSGEQSDMPEPSSVQDMRREIDMLCELINSFSLSDERRETLRQCKNELEEKLNMSLKLTVPQGTGDQTEEKRTSQISEPVVGKDEASEEACTDETTLQKTKTDKTELSTVQVLASPSTQSRLNVTATPFVPHQSYQSHRSPANSISSDSTRIQQTPCRDPRHSSLSRPLDSLQQQTTGENPLPGRPLDPLQHIFGDHLLPGRRKDTAEAETDIPEMKQLPSNGKDRGGSCKIRDPTTILSECDEIRVQRI